MRTFLAWPTFLAAAVVALSSIFNNATLAMLEAVPEIRGEPDLGAVNEGVTMLWLR